jgi:phosphohistidine phosphatase
MKRLILMRHAKSSWDDEGLADHERPLSPRGERDAPRMAERLAQRGERPSLYLSSSATRALRTAELVAAVLEPPPEALRVEPALYLAAPAAILAAIAAQSDAHASMIVFGHNPGFTELANALLPELELDNLSTAGVVAIDCAMLAWRDVSADAARLDYLDYPKNARG